MGDAGKEGGVCDLVAVQVQDGQHRSVVCWGEELVELPGGGQRAGLGLAVAHHGGGDEAGVIRHGAEGVGQRVAQLAALVDGAGSLRRHMAGDAAGEGKALEEPLHALPIPADVGVDLLIAAVQPVLGHHGVAAVAGAGEIDHVQVILFDDPVQMGVDEVLARAGAPVAHDLFLDMLGGEGFFQKGVIQQVELAGREVVGCAPVGVHQLKLRIGCRGIRAFFFHGKASFNSVWYYCNTSRSDCKAILPVFSDFLSRLRRAFPL